MNMKKTIIAALLALVAMRGWAQDTKIGTLAETMWRNETTGNYDIVYLYLANTSPEDSWKNVIKEYSLTGPNCVHYNLPREQQAAVERFLNVDSFPTYKLIDKQGNIHPLYWQHHEDMKSFLETIDKMSK